MPYELAFTKQISTEDLDIYINDCCFGGDVISEHLLPTIRTHYTDIQHEQEDWGWFLWFTCGPTKLAVDSFCDDSKAGAYRIHLTSQVKRTFFGYTISDTAELEELKGRLTGLLEGWIDGSLSEAVLDKNHEPIDAG